MWFKAGSRTHSLSLGKKGNSGAAAERFPGAQGSTFSRAPRRAGSNNSEAEVDSLLHPSLPPGPMSWVSPVSCLLSPFSLAFFLSVCAAWKAVTPLGLVLSASLISLALLSPNSSCLWVGLWLMRAESSVCPCPMSWGQCGRAGGPLPFCRDCG